MGPPLLILSLAGSEGRVSEGRERELAGEGRGGERREERNCIAHGSVHGAEKLPSTTKPLYRLPSQPVALTLQPTSGPDIGWREGWRCGDKGSQGQI